MLKISFAHLNLFVDIVGSEASSADWLQQTKHVARGLYHGVRSEMLDQPHQIIEFFTATNIVFVLLGKEIEINE